MRFVKIDEVLIAKEEKEAYEAQKKGGAKMKIIVRRVKEVKAEGVVSTTMRWGNKLRLAGSKRGVRDRKLFLLQLSHCEASTLMSQLHRQAVSCRSASLPLRQQVTGREGAT